MGPPSLAERFRAAPPRSVAVVLLSAIGDVVHGMPVAASLRRAWPGTRIEWVIQPTGHALVAPHPDVDAFRVFRREEGLGAFLDFRGRTRDRAHDLVLDLQVYFKAGVLTALLDAPVKLGFDRARARDLNPLFTTHRIPPRPVRHVQDQYFEFLEHLGVPVVREWDFAFRAEEREARRRFFDELERPVLAVVAATTREEKDWIPSRFARVVEVAAREHGMTPVLVGSEAPRETDAARAIVRTAGRRGVEVIDARRNDLRRLAWILDGADLLLSPDTGPLHVAAALGTPVIGLYGYTDPRRTGPYPAAFRELVVDAWSGQGEGGARGAPGGAPDGARGGAPGGDPGSASAGTRPGRMERITVDRVLEKLELAVERHL